MTQPSAAPRISVLLPVHDAETTLGDCLRSLQRQRERRWECLLIDDGSGDATLRVARRHAARDPRIRIVRSQHRGLVGALTVGLPSCRGDLVARMDADDLMHRDRLADQAAQLDADGGLDAVGCHVRLFPRRGLSAGSRAYERWINSILTERDVVRDVWIECPVVHPTLMFRRDALLRHGYRDAGWPEDYDLVLRMLLAGARVGVLPRRRLCWRDHPGRLSRRSATYAIERFTRCKAAFLAESLLAGIDRYVLWGYGSTGRTLRRALEPHGKRPSHIVELHPGRLGNRIHGAPVVPPSALPSLPRVPILASVAGRTARAEIRRELAAMGFVEGRDFVCTA